MSPSRSNRCRCGKVRFWTRDSADRAARRINGEVGRRRMRVYKGACGSWHLTRIKTLNEMRERAGLIEPIHVVTGMGRCGLTMVTHMLVVGGIEPVCPYPYESDWTGVDREWRPETVEHARGRVVKVVTPLATGIREHFGPFNIVMMTRHPVEQARSQRQFTKWSVDFDIGRDAMHAWAKDNPVKDQQQREMFTSWKGSRFIELRFEDVIQDPPIAALKLVDFFGLDRARADAMAATVLERSVMCSPSPREPRLFKLFGDE